MLTRSPGDTSHAPVHYHCYVRLLGGLLLRTYDGTEVTRFRSRQTASLLAYLAFFPDKPHTRTALMEMLWPEMPERSQRNSLSVALSSLRVLLEAVPPGAPRVVVLEADSQNIRLIGSVIETDVHEFERLLVRGERDNALSVYGGPLLPGFYEDWITLAAPRLEELFVQAVLRQSDDWERQGIIEAARDLLRAAALKAPDAAELRDALWNLSDTLPGKKPVERSIRRAAPHTARPAPLPTPAPIPALPTPEALPATYTRFFGRETERETVAHLLRNPAETRLVTLTGPGGIGKTRLALEAVREANIFDDATAFAACSEATDTVSFAEAIRHALLPPGASGAGEPLEQAVEILRLTNKSRFLLVLDNLEQINGVVEVIDTLLVRVPTLTVLATSRIPVRSDAETILPVGPLSADASNSVHGAATEPPAVALFLDRARKVRPDLRVTPRLVSAVAELCDALDGLPLALEMAAARANVFSPAQMRERLAARDRREVLLSTGRRGIPDRHRSLDACLQWSVDLLSPGARRLFAQLSVFHGGWTIDAAEMICPGAQAALHLQELVEASLVRVSEYEDGEVRFSFLVTVGAFALERLAETPAEERATRERHAAYFTEWAARHNHEAARVNSEIPNLRAALEWLDKEDTARHRRLTLAVIQPAVLAWREEATRHLEQALYRAETDRERLPLLLAKTEMLQRLAEPGSLWLPVAEEAEAIARHIGDRPGLAYALSLRSDSPSHLAEASRAAQEGHVPFLEASAFLLQARYAFWQGETYPRWNTPFRRALELSQRGIGRYQELCNLLRPEYVQFEWGYILLQRGELAEAEPLLTEAVARCGPGSLFYGHPQWMLARVYLMRGDIARALLLSEESVEAGRRGGNARIVAGCLVVLAQIHLAAGDGERAEACLIEADERTVAADGEAGRERVAPTWVHYWLARHEPEQARLIMEPFAHLEPPSDLMGAVSYSAARQAWGRILLARGEPHAALIPLRESLRARRTYGSFPAVCDDIEAIVAARYALGTLALPESAALLAAVEAARARLGTPLPSWLHWLRERTALLLTPPDLADARQTGSCRTLDEAADRALTG